MVPRRRRTALPAPRRKGVSAGGMVGTMHVRAGRSVRDPVRACRADRLRQPSVDWTADGPSACCSDRSLLSLARRVERSRLSSAYHALVSRHAGAADLPHFFLDGVLALLLFAGSLHVDVAELRRRRWMILLLATASVMMSTLVFGGGMWLMFGADRLGGSAGLVPRARRHPGADRRRRGRKPAAPGQPATGPARRHRRRKPVQRRRRRGAVSAGAGRHAGRHGRDRSRQSASGAGARDRRRRGARRYRPAGSPRC